MSDVLIAARPCLAAHLAKLLGDEHTVDVVSTKSDALALLSDRHFDLILCGTQFDNGSLFDFLSMVPSDTGRGVVCIRFMESSISNAFSAPIRLAVGCIPGATYVDANDLSNQELVAILNRSFLSQTVVRNGVENSGENN